MPRIKRWFHVSHDINSDGEVWELTDKFGVAGLRVWLEMLSIADRNEGHLPDLSEATLRQLSIRCNTTQRHLRGILEYTQTRLWIVSDPSPRVRNWLIYNPSRDVKKAAIVSPPILPILSDHPKIKNQPPKSEATAAKAAPRAEADPEPAKPKPRPLSPELEAAGMRIYKLDKVKYDRLWEWIGAKRKAYYSDALLAQVLVRFAPYADDPNIGWWQYLTAIVAKEQSKANGRASEAEGERYKREEREWLQSQSN